MAGDSVQLLICAKYLREKGIEVDINNIINFEKYDIIHLFNLTRINETYEYYQMAKKINKTIVITPVYWNLQKFYMYTGNLYRIALWEKNMQLRKEILNGCKMIYPSSYAELKLLQSEFGENLPYTVVYNCADFNFTNTDIQYEKDSYIICAARVCPRKNQLILSKLCNDLGEKLILAGETNSQDYLERCLKFNNVSYVGFKQKNELYNLYRNAKLHVLCSFVETPGLSNLEAGACGCNIISTTEGATGEYFEDMAVYCNPYDEDDIYKSIKEGLKFNRQPDLKNHISHNFNPEKCLNTLYNSYINLNRNS